MSELEAGLAEITSERDGVARERDAAVRQGEVMAREKEEALRLAREAEERHLARAEALEAEKRQVREEGERNLRLLYQTQEELERIALVDQEKEARIGELQRRVEGQTAQVSELEAGLAEITSERDGVARERDAAVRQGEVMAREKGEALIALGDLTDKLGVQAEALRLAQEAEARHAARAEELEGQKQQASEEAERLRQQLNQSQGELERMALVDQEKEARIGELQRRVEGQTAQVSELEAGLAEITSERDGVARERDAVGQQLEEAVREKAKALIALGDLSDQIVRQAEVSRLAREEQAQHAARAEALAHQKQTSSEEMARILGLLHQTQAELERYALLDQGKGTRIEELQQTIVRRTVQLTSLQEELENHFLYSKAGDQLIEAQDRQLKRAHSLMSRLLAQVIRRDPSSPAIAVEVVTPQLADSQSRSLPGGGVPQDRQGWASSLLKRVLRQ